MPGRDGLTRGDVEREGRQSNGTGTDSREAARLRAKLKGFISSLPRTERLVFLLRYADDLSPFDIGLVTGLPAHVVSGILRRVEGQARSVVTPPVSAVFG